MEDPYVPAVRLGFLRVGHNDAYSMVEHCEGETRGRWWRKEKEEMGMMEGIEGGRRDEEWRKEKEEGR